MCEQILNILHAHSVCTEQRKLYLMNEHTNAVGLNGENKNNKYERKRLEGEANEYELFHEEEKKKNRSQPTHMCYGYVIASSNAF